MLYKEGQCPRGRQRVHWKEFFLPSGNLKVVVHPEVQSNLLLITKAFDSFFQHLENLNSKSNVERILVKH